MSLPTIADNQEQIAPVVDAFSPPTEYARAWHEHTGPIYPERYQQRSRLLQSVPFIERTVFEKLICVPCLTVKMKRAPLRHSTQNTSAPLELIHIDISGKVVPSRAKSIYTIAVLDVFTALSAIYTIKKKI